MSRKVLGTELNLDFMNNINSMTEELYAKDTDLDEKMDNQDEAHKNSTTAHPAEHITYNGNVAGQKNVKEAIDNVQSQVNSVVVGGTEVDPRVSQALVDSEGTTHENLKIRNDTWEARTKNLEDEVLAAAFTPEIINNTAIYNSGIGTNENGDILNYVIEDGQVSVGIKGQTIFQYADNGVDYVNWTVAGTGTTKSADGIHLVTDGANDKAELLTNLKNGQQATVFITVTSENLNNVFYFDGRNEFDIGLYTINQNVGTKKLLVTATKDNPKLLFVNGGDNTDGTYIDFTDIMILEGDYTNDDSIEHYLSYGTNSTLSQRVTSVNKNLLDSSKLELGSINSLGEEESSTTTIRSSFIRLNPNKDTITFSEAINESTTVRWYFYKSNKNFVETSFSTLPYPRSIPESAKGGYVRVRFSTTDLTKKFQVEYGSTATDYVKYEDSEAYYSVPEGCIAGSVPNGANNYWKDGKFYEEVKERTQNTISGLYTSYSNVDYALIPKPSDFKYATTNYATNTGIVGSFNFGGLNVTTSTDYTNTDQIGKVNVNFSAGSLVIGFIKGTTQQDMQNFINNHSLIYQLLQEVNHPIEGTGYKVFRNGIEIWDPYLRQSFAYDASTGNGIDFPSKTELSKIDKVKYLNGDLVPEEYITLAADGKSCTISGAVDGDSYTVYGPIKPELSTIPITVKKYAKNKAANDVAQNAAIGNINNNMLTVQDQVANILLEMM